MENRRIIVVTWLDAHGDSIMFTEEDMEHKPYKFISIGLLVRSDDVGVSLAREIGEDGRFRDHEFIPRKMIVDEYELGYLRKPRKRKSTQADKIELGSSLEGTRLEPPDGN